MANEQPAALVNRVESKILLIRGQKVMLDEDLAALYQVKTKRGIVRFNRGLFLVLRLAFFSFLLVTSTAWAFPINQCASDRAAVDLGCTAADVSISSVTVASGGGDIL